jgi:hypothetical protein
MHGLIYLLHFDRPISAAHSCQHYIGWCLDITARLGMHRAGKGARLTQIAVERGISFEVVRTWPGTRALERQLKNRKEAPRLCPMCCQIHGWRPRAADIDVVQLALPLDIPDDFPELPHGRMDWLEISTYQRWRASRPALPTNGLADDLL